MDTTAYVQAAQRGDQAALATLMQGHLPYVRRIVSLNLGVRLARLVEVEDVVQETAVDAIKGLGSTRIESSGAFRAWLAKIVENRVRDLDRWHRAGKRDAAVLAPLGEHDSRLLLDSVFRSEETTPSEAFAVMELGMRIEDGLLRLPERERRAIVMRRFEERDFGEIASELGLGQESSARALFARALAKLSERI